MHRTAARLALVVLAPAAAAFAVELAARSWPGGAPTDTESALLWVAGTRPAFVCDAGGSCRTDPGLVRLSNPDKRFSTHASSGTFRVVCVGDSTTAGWPYQPRGGYPERLELLLRAALPGRRVEVLNLGIHAWDGARLETVFDQALGFAPDALVVRVGYDDYPHFLLRRPRGGAWGRAALKLRLELLAHSAAFRVLARGLGPAPRRGIVASAVAVLTNEENDALVAAHADRLRAFAARARAAGVPLVVLGLPSWDDFAPTFPGLPALARQRRATAETARALELPYSSLDDVPVGRFIDIVHVDADGERLVAVDAAHALQAAGLPAPGVRWRWNRVPPPAAQERLLGLADGEYRTHIEDLLALFFLSHKLHARAARCMESALRAAPNADLVPEEILGLGDSTLAELYRQTFARLRRAGRIAEPLKPADRALAGL